LRNVYESGGAPVFCFRSNEIVAIRDIHPPLMR
jgi:hypothetical protein